MTIENVRSELEKLDGNLSIKNAQYVHRHPITLDRIFLWDKKLLMLSLGRLRTVTLESMRNTNHE